MTGRLHGHILLGMLETTGEADPVAEEATPCCGDCAEREARLRAEVLEVGPTRLHAGLVAYGPVAIVLPGRSRSGKSTLVAALARLGARVVSDEWTVVDGGVLGPSPRQLRLREDVRDAFDAPLREAADLARVRVGLVAFCRYVPGATWAARRLTRAEAVAMALTHCPMGQARPRQTMREVARAFAGARFLTVERGDATRAAAALLALVDPMAAGR